MKGEINNNTIIVGDLIPHSHLWIYQQTEINKETQTLNDTMGQLDLMVSIGHFTPNQSISPFSQVHTEPSAE